MNRPNLFKTCTYDHVVGVIYFALVAWISYSWCALSEYVSVFTGIKGTVCIAGLVFQIRQNREVSIISN